MRNILRAIICIVGVVALVITVVDQYSIAQMSNIAGTNAVRFVERDSSRHSARINDVRSLLRILRAAGFTVNHE